MPTDLQKAFKAARRVSTPLVAIKTPDAAATINVITSLLETPQQQPVLSWDVARALIGVNEAGRQLIKSAWPGLDMPAKTMRPVDMLDRIATLGKDRDAVIFMCNAQEFWKEITISQRIWNLRDSFKAEGNMLVMLTTQGVTLPSVLMTDVFVIDEPLPSRSQLRPIIDRCFFSNDGSKPTDADYTRASDAMLGLAAYPAEQSLQMNLTKTRGLDADGLWDEKRKLIEETPGLSVYRGGEKFADLGGLANVKNYNRRMIDRKLIDVVLFWDEIEKMVAGAMTDSSGVGGKMLGKLLTWMNDRRVKGQLYIGHPGSGKSAMAKAIGNEAGVLTVRFDTAAMENSLVGKSIEQLDSALKRVDVLGERIMVVATSNDISRLPTELRRRFKDGTFFYDLPQAEEREVIWKLYLNYYNIAKQKLPESEGWTGAEIENCCSKSSDQDMGLTLVESSAYIVPVCRANPEGIKKFCVEASGRFISASEPGVYEYRETVTAREGGRRVRKD